MHAAAKGQNNRRTRERLLERFIIDAGHTAHRLAQDYGYDLLLLTYDGEGYIEPGVVFLQLKASETLERSRRDYVFDLDVRDYHLWVNKNWPVFLVLFDARRRRAYRLDVQEYFDADASRRPKKGARTVRVRVPSRQVISCRAIAQMRLAKQAVVAAGKRERSDV